MHTNVLHITNGECFNAYFLQKWGGDALPFCEAMMDGDATEDILSDAFISLRTRALGVDEATYRAKLGVCDALAQHAYTSLSLYFGKDTFCQMNLLTLLAYLEQIGYSGDVVLNYIDDASFAIIEDGIPVHLGAYRQLYREILLEKQMPREVGVLVPEAITLYFDYRAENGYLARLVKAHPDLDAEALTVLLLKASAAYGLSDTQAKRLIQSCRA